MRENEADFKFVDHYFTQCVWEQIQEMKVGRMPLTEVIEKCIKQVYVDAYNSGEKSAMWRTYWHTAKCDPLRVVRQEDRIDGFIDMTISDGTRHESFRYDIKNGEFPEWALVWKLVDKPNIESIKKWEIIWPENTIH